MKKMTNKGTINNAQNYLEQVVRKMMLL
uniref:Uncharacterized protein n=1 Tax=Arundo donax TaxID=35708 RepID=A0A0A9HQ97_ARUDO